MGKGPQVEQGNLRVQDGVSEVPIQSLVIWWNIFIRQGTKPLLLMNAHIFSQISATSSGRNSVGFPGTGTPKDAKNARHSDASESRASDI